MSRYRARTAPSEADRDITRHLDEAARHVGLALDTMRQHKTARSRGRKRRVEEDLMRVLGAISNVGSLEPRYGGVDDPDLMSEDARAAKQRAERDARRAAERGDG